MIAIITLRHFLRRNDQSELVFDDRIGRIKNLVGAADLESADVGHPVETLIHIFEPDAGFAVADLHRLVLRALAGDLLQAGCGNSQSASSTKSSSANSSTQSSENDSTKAVRSANRSIRNNNFQAAYDNLNNTNNRSNEAIENF